ncbi:MAG: twin-arginine translocase TatA/TatE family subunit [Candidatus Zixiibacteriota bacterium]
MFGLGIAEIAIIAGIIFLLFGGKILSRFARNSATAIIESRKAAREIIAAANGERD